MAGDGTLTVHKSHLVNQDTRAATRGHKGFTIWLTGLSASGKSTIAIELEHQLSARRGCICYCLDGDGFRHGLSAGLKFKEHERTENIRRVAHVARFLSDSNTITIASFISPLPQHREAVRDILCRDDEMEILKNEKDRLRFVEVYVDVDIETASKRDPKGYYARAIAGDPDFKFFTGIDPKAPYFPPQNPDVHIKNYGDLSVEAAAQQIIDYLDEQKLIPTLPEAIEVAAKNIANLTQQLTIPSPRPQPPFVPGSIPFVIPVGADTSAVTGKKDAVPEATEAPAIPNGTKAPAVEIGDTPHGAPAADGVPPTGGPPPFNAAPATTEVPAATEVPPYDGAPATIEAPTIPEDSKFPVDVKSAVIPEQQAVPQVN